MISYAYDTNRMLYIFHFVLAPLPYARPGGEPCVCIYVCLEACDYTELSSLGWRIGADTVGVLD